MAEPLRNPEIPDDIAESAMRARKVYRTASEDLPALRPAYNNVVQRAVQSCGYLAENSSRLPFRAREELRRAVQERPLHLLGAIGALAFAAGIAVRIWRSKSS